MTRTTSTLQSASALGEFAAFATRSAPLASSTTPRPRRRVAKSVQPSRTPAATPPVSCTPPHSRTSRQQAELDIVIRALDDLLSAPPAPQFDATLAALNARIDAVSPDDITATPAASSAAPLPDNLPPLTCGDQPMRCSPCAIARSRPKLTDDGDYEPLNFNAALWRALRVAAAHDLPLASPPPEQVITAPSSDLSTDCLRDLLELSQDGIRVEWPQGLDANTAQTILRVRSAAEQVVPSPVAPIPAEPSDRITSTVSADFPVQPSCSGSHPPGVFLSQVSPDGATRAIHTRRILDGTPTCIEEQSEVPFSSSSTSRAHHPPGLYTSEVSPDGATRVIQTRRIEVTNCTAQSSTSFSSSKVGPHSTTPCTEQASSPRPEPARAGGARRKPMTRQVEESACAAAPPAPALVANLPDEALDDTPRTSRPIREPSDEQPLPRATSLGEQSALLGPVPRAGSLPVRGSAGVFGKKNQR